jgi:hypothetical protein
LSVEDALGSIVVGFKRRASSRLGVLEFCEGGTDGTGMFAADIDATGFGFGGGQEDIFYCLAEDVKGAVDTVVVVPAKVIVDGSSTAGLGLDEIGGVGSDF